ncbi:ABC transporter, ATP-binding protein [Thermogutta terrifontis]|uniref:ABC transporter, ATP-binding protein n=1 Tax=Thermogutta terrifontis TaxID=1331910 RepID=A0A286RK51_9BACT|nr:ABC transporter ATP-binding protein [Thermogutta terrifontis]ASV76353.1 ABC transporter, ATP-binding protein [Thermogutta terrifontis]
MLGRFLGWTHHAASKQAMTDSSGDLLRVVQVTKVFQMGEVILEALKDVSLDIYEGEFLVVLGPSGSGKSTLLNLIGGLDRPTVGHVLYRGMDLSTFSHGKLTWYRREVIGFVFQFYNLISNLTAIENVMLAANLVTSPLDPYEVLEKVGLRGRANSFPAQLSGGEQQRVAIARALVKNPPLLLCDEPTGALDDVTGRQILRLLLDLCREMKKTVVLITHNTAISQMADRVVRLRSGRIVEVFHQPHPLPPESIQW